MARVGFTSYDPLDRRNLARSVQRELLGRRLGPLPPPEPFVGAGLYALYYRGAHPAYGPIAGGDIPIYVGQATPARPMDWGTDPLKVGRVLYNRLRRDAASLDQADDLDRADFRCRYLVVDDVWIALAGKMLVTEYRPVWNMVLRGFASHDPGPKRGNGRSHWDVAHPGRQWADRQPAGQAIRDDLFESVARHLGKNTIM